MYDLRKWRRLRDEFAKANPLCAECERKGKIKLGSEVDHIEPHRNDPNLMWDWGNLQHLCTTCHSAKTERENGGAHRAALLPRFIERPDKPLIVVCGPPGAGKHEYVRRNVKAGDLVVTMDELAHEVVGKPLHECEQSERDRCLRERNKIIAQFCEGATDHRRCFLIATAGKYAHRKFWEERGASVVVINPGVDECVMAVEASTSLPERRKAELVAAIRSWS